MGKEVFVIILILALVCGMSFVISGDIQRDKLLSAYCESQSAQYEIVSGEYYCIKDNQLFQIEWVKE